MTIKQSTVGSLAIGACALIAAGSLVVSVLFVSQDREDDKRTDQQLDAILEARAEARKITCEKDLKFTEAHNKLVIALATAGGTREITPEVQPLVDEQLVRVPDCSDEGIELFYQGEAK